MDKLFYFERKTYGSEYNVKSTHQAGIVGASNTTEAMRKLEQHFELEQGKLWTNSTELGPMRHYKAIPSDNQGDLDYVVMIESDISCTKPIPPGRYLICDPCYLEVDTIDGILTPKAIGIANTGGDGGHRDNQHRVFGVDSGRLGVFPADKHQVPTSEYRGDLGHLLDFQETWQLITVRDGTAASPVQYRVL